jgi:hypothetical protein
MSKEVRVFLEAVAVDAVLFTAGFFLFLEKGREEDGVFALLMLSAVPASFYLAVRSYRPTLGSAARLHLSLGAAFGLTVAVVVTTASWVGAAMAPKGDESFISPGAAAMLVTIAAFALVVPGLAVLTAIFGLILGLMVKEQ